MVNDNSFTDLRQSDNYASYIKNIGWEADKFQNVYIYLKKFLFWKFIKIQRPQNINLEKLNSYLIKYYRFSTVYIEPSDERQRRQLLELGYSEYNSPFLPSKTVCINLTQSDEEMLKAMHYKTRYNINHYFKEKNRRFKIGKTVNIEKFAYFWQSCAKERGMFLSQKKEITALYNAFKNNSKIYYAGNNYENWLAAIFTVSTGEITYYMYAASTKVGKKGYAPTVLAWEALTSAKKENKKIFDFEGIYDDRYPLKSWKGFTRFKRSFGGKEIEYPGCLTKIIF